MIKNTVFNACVIAVVGFTGAGFGALTGFVYSDEFFSGEQYWSDRGLYYSLRSRRFNVDHYRRIHGFAFAF